MAILDTSAFTNALKVLYPNGLEEQWYQKAPFLAWVPKTYNFEGASKQTNPIYAGIRGSTDFATALSAKSTPSIAKFNVTRVKDYVIGSIDNEALMASRSQKGAVAQALKTQVDAALYEFAKSQSFQVWGDGSGTRGTVSSYSSTVITLTNATDVIHFEVGMELEKKNSSGTLLSGSMTVTAIDADLGKLTVTLNGGAADPAANDTLARAGDYTASASNCLAGILDWIPVTAPASGDSHFGVDRSVHVNRLAGSRFDGNGAPIEETVMDAQALLMRHGGSADTLWLSPQRFFELAKSAQSKAWYAQTQVASSAGRTGKVQVGFPGFSFAGPRGVVTVMCDEYCPNAYGILTRKEAWELASLGDYPHFSEEDGKRFSRESSADAVEFRLKGYGNLLCHRPLDNVLITWD